MNECQSYFDVVTTHQLRRELRAHRLAKGLTYEQLAGEINATVGDDRVSPSTVYRFLEKDDAEPRDTAIYAYEQYLAKVEAEKVA